MIGAVKLCKKCGYPPDIQRANGGMYRISCHKCRVATKIYEAFAPANSMAAIEMAIAEWNEMNTEKEG